MRVITVIAITAMAAIAAIALTTAPRRKYVDNTAHKARPGYMRLQ